MSERDEKEMMRLADLGDDFLEVIDKLAGDLPSYLDNNNEEWCRDIRKLFNIAANYRVETVNVMAEERKEKYILSRLPRVADQHEQETFGEIGEPEEHLEYGGAVWPEKPYTRPLVEDKNKPDAMRKNEVDPSGLDAHSPGAKLDAGKPMVDDILAGFPRALLAVAEVGTFGAKKYTLNGWQDVENGKSRYRNAAGRHRLYVQIGDDIDPDSGLSHRAHEAWNVLAALELELKEKENGS